MALSAAEEAYIRSMLPTYATTDPAYVSQDQLNYLYANKAGSSLDKTIAYALRQMCVKLSNKVGRTNTATGDTIQSQQEREAVCAQAAQWAKDTGVLSGSAVVVTGFVTRQDGYSDDIDAAESDDNDLTGQLTNP